jgi:hypothetical protein
MKKSPIVVRLLHIIERKQVGHSSKPKRCCVEQVWDNVSASSSKQSFSSKQLAKSKEDPSLRLAVAKEVE